MQASAVAASGVQTLHSIIISREISPSGFRPRDNSARRGREEEGGGVEKEGGRSGMSGVTVIMWWKEDKWMDTFDERCCGAT